MYAISIRQPDADALLAGRGPVEHAAWQTDHRGPLLIHAEKPEGGKGSPAGLTPRNRHALIGVVDLVDCVRDEHRSADPDEAGHHWVLANPRVFATPVPHNGKVGMFQVSDLLVAAALAQAEPPPSRKRARKNRPPPRPRWANQGARQATNQVPTQ